MRARYGELLSPRSKASLIGSVRTFFCDVQEWEWIERRFDPRRALGIPRSIAALIGPDPRVIAEEVWAKLMWAGLNLDQDDLPQARPPGRNRPRVVSARARPRRRAVVAVRRAARRRDPEAQGRRDPLADHTRRRHERAGVSAGRSDEQDHQRVHQARRPDRRRRNRSVAGRPARPTQVPGPQNRSARRHAARLPRRPTRREVHQPGARPAALPQGRRPRRGRPRGKSPATAPGRRSPPSSTTPRTR
jgi:hypothetical protein